MASQLNTERLILSPFTVEDAELFHRLNNDAYIRKYMWDDESIDKATAKEIIQRNDKSFKANKYGIWKIQQKGNRKVIGYVGLWFFFDEPQPQLIYALLQPYTKKGYASEASIAIIEYTFENLGFEYLIAATDESHLESQKVAERLGMTFVEKRIENHKPTLFF
ncbi:MAG: GNAT family N-acetyltransferase, partial [Bacteroidota bacterium]